MFIRCAFFQGKVKPGMEDAFLKDGTVTESLKKKSAQKGDCFQAAGRYFQNHMMEDPSLRLVHGEVGHPKAPNHGHAWIEETPGGGCCLVLSLPASKPS